MKKLTAGSNGDVILPVRWQRIANQVPHHWALFDFQTLKHGKEKDNLNLLDIFLTRLGINSGPSLQASIFC
jgi:hypothetical protein